MKRNITFPRLFWILSLLLGGLCVSNAQPNSIFYEDFEQNVFPPSGWTVIDDDQELSYYHWHLMYDEKGAATLSGLRSAYVDTKVYDTPEDHKEPAKHEWLITPEISLPSDKSALLSFLWQAQKIQALDNKTYNAWVLVTTNEGATWDTLWSLTDPVKMINSGVAFPWENFGRYKSELDLTKYKGKKIKIAWYYHNFYFGQGDMFKIDNISLVKYDPVFNPIASLDPASYSFTNAYIGVTISSGNVFNLKNIGIDTLRIKSIEGLEGTDFKCMIEDISLVELKKNDVFPFAVYYTPTLEGAKNAKLTIKTNGGDVVLNLTGNKISLPTDYTLESFEGEGFPPVGWTNNKYRKIASGSSGYYSASPSFDNRSVLTSPRLDLSKGSSHYTSLDFVNYADDEEWGSVCDNVDKIEFSSDGGKNWQAIYTLNPSDKDYWTRVKVNLPASTSDNAYLRFTSTIEGELSFDVLMSMVLIDNVVLPPLYGSNLAPSSTSNPIPAHDATNQFVNALSLSWQDVLHAKSYKVKVGTTAQNTGDIFNESVSQTKIRLSNLEYNKTYYWSVTPTNDYGDASDVKLWSFTTMEDQTLSSFPYKNGFEATVFPDLGWRTETLEKDGPKWGRSDVSPYDGKYSAYCSSHVGTAILSMPPIKLPAEKEMQMAFYWGNDAPVGLTKKLNAVSSGDKGLNADSAYFEISTDEMTWKSLACLSEESRDEHYWYRVKVVLSEYAGKTVFLRWRYKSLSYATSDGLSIDNVVIEEYAPNGKAVFNIDAWNAGIINTGETLDSKSLLTMSNDGEATLTIESVKFTHKNFSTDLQIGASIVKNASMAFKITFNSVPAANIKDTMKIVFANGVEAYFPVSGNALPINKRCYTFDHVDAFELTIPHFTLLDVDGKATCEPVLIYYPRRGTPLPFMVMNVKEADWRNVYPVSGDQCLVAFSAADWASSMEDWIISEKMKATQTSSLRFYAKSYGSPEDFSLSTITVLISETDNQKNSFKALAGHTNMPAPYNKDGQWGEFEIDLSAYDGKQIYVAICQKMDKDGFVMFMDDIWFENFQFETSDNQAPKFTTTPPASAKLNEAFSYTFKVIDPEGDKLSFNVVGLPSWLTVNYTEEGGSISGTPTVAGNVFFKIVASDGILETSQEVLFAVHSSDNKAPSFNSSVPNPNIKIGEEFVYEFKASDPEGDPMSFSVEDMPSWLNVSYNRVDGGVVRGTPTTAGEYVFKLKVSDGMLSAEQEIRIQVATSIEDNIEKVSFLCYPNPVYSVLHIKTSSSNYEVCLSDITGKNIFKAKNPKSLSMENFTKGMYLLKITTPNGVDVQRIIKY